MLGITLSCSGCNYIDEKLKIYSKTEPENYYFDSFGSFNLGDNKIDRANNLVVADFNGDGKLDIAYIDWNKLVILKNRIPQYSKTIVEKE